MKKFKTKPVIKEAVQFVVGPDGPTDHNWREIEGFMGKDHDCLWVDGQPVIQTLEGDMLVNDGDWIIKGLSGEFYPCKPDIFEKTYEAVEDE